MVLGGYALAWRVLRPADCGRGNGPGPAKAREPRARMDRIERMVMVSRLLRRNRVTTVIGSGTEQRRCLSIPAWLDFIRDYLQGTRAKITSSPRMMTCVLHCKQSPAGMHGQRLHQAGMPGFQIACSADHQLGDDGMNRIKLPDLPVGVQLGGMPSGAG